MALGTPSALKQAPAAKHRASPRLRGRTVPVSSVGGVLRHAAFALFQASYDGADWERFQRDLDEKQFMILLFEVSTGKLKGFSTVQVLRRGTSTVIFSGDTVIAPECWGQKELQRHFARLILRLKLRNPLRPVYWFLISKGYRTYLMMVRRCPRSIPRYDRVDDPGLRTLLDALATERFGHRYDAAASVASDLGHDRVRAGVAPIDAAVEADPHVRFFQARNPGHVQGDELCCLAETRLRDAARTLVRKRLLGR
jgi:hypothetical protein